MKKIIGLLLLVSLSSSMNGQNDCVNPLVVCGNKGFNNIEVSGPGIQELVGTNSCASEEHNSLWFDITIKTGGTLAFILKPESDSIIEDFDFFVFGPNVSCTNLGRAIRCSTTNPLGADLLNNHTGMSENVEDISEGPGSDGNSFVSALEVAAGERYFIVIDRPIGSSNFTIDWTGTAEFNDAPKAEIPLGVSIDLEECDSIMPYDDKVTNFDLTRNDFIIGNQTDVSISYHLNNTDANIGINVISEPETFINTSNNQLIFARLENTITGCYSISSFKLHAINGINVQQQSIKECDENNDGFANFNLENLNSKVLVSDIPDNYEFSYHLTKVDAEKNVRKLPENYTNSIQNEQEIYVRVVNTANRLCKSVVKATLLVLASPEILNVVDLKQCDDDTDGITFFNLEEVNSKISENYLSENMTFYKSLENAQNKVDNILNISAYQNKIPLGDALWCRVENSKECYKVAKIQLKVSATKIPADFFREFQSCDTLESESDQPNDGISIFDFSSVDTEIKKMFSDLNQSINVSYYESQSNALAEKNAISDISNFRNVNSPFHQKIYVRVDSNLNNDCLGLGHHITLTVNYLPEFYIDAPEYLCTGSVETLVANISGDQNVFYSWSYKGGSSVLGKKKRLMISRAGEYELIVAKIATGCADVKNVTVNVSSRPTIHRDDIVIFDDLNLESNEYKVQIKEENLGVGNYEFSLKDEEGLQVPFQLIPEFKNLKEGKYILIVRDTNGCQPNAELEFNILKIPKFFTPNGDGKNDVWLVKGLDKNLYKSGEVIIFNRFGKVVYKDSIFSSGWDGRFNGDFLKDNDYWFFISLTDIDENYHKYEGHFTLLRK